MPFTTTPTKESTGDGLGQITDLAQVAKKTGNKNPTTILDELSKFFSTPLAKATYKCNPIICPLSEAQKEGESTKEKTKPKTCSKMDVASAKVTIPKESGSFSLYFTGGISGQALSVAAAGSAAATVSVKVDVKYLVSLTSFDFDVHGCGDGECEPDHGECTAFLHCEVAFSCEVSAGVDLGFGSVATGSAAGVAANAKIVIAADWKGNPTYTIAVGCK